jgi:hypothetical protein
MSKMHGLVLTWEVALIITARELHGTTIVQFCSLSFSPHIPVASQTVPPDPCFQETPPWAKDSAFGVGFPNDISQGRIGLVTDRTWTSWNIAACFLASASFGFFKTHRCRWG